MDYIKIATSINELGNLQLNSKRIDGLAHILHATVKAALEEYDAQIVALKQELDDARTARWQPIETAPKDGSRMLLWTVWRDGFEFADTGYWSDLHGGGWVRNGAGTPTHWMPLPPHPDRRRGGTE